MTLIPGLLSVASMGFLVTEKRRAPNHELRFSTSLGAMPKEYRRFLPAVGLFGMADFAPTLMILRATTLLEPQMGILEASRMATLFYLLRNVTYAAASYPIGALSHKFPRTRYLAVGYGVAVVTFLGFALAIPSIWWFLVFFSLAGVLHHPVATTRMRAAYILGEIGDKRAIAPLADLPLPLVSRG